MALTAMSKADERKHEGTAKSVTVMIVDDSAVVRGLVSRWIDEEPSLVVAAKHANGKAAVDDIAKSKPDIVILDIEMPVMDGLTALPQLLKQHPSTKVIMSSTLTRRNAEVSLKALSLGATEYVAKPESNRGVTTSKEFRTELINKVKALGQVPTESAFGARIKSAKAAPRTPQPGQKRAASAKSGASYSLRKFSKTRPRILAIGSSTGGPEALQKFFKAVTPALGSLPIVLTQHMPATFTAILAEHIASATGRAAAEGKDGEAIAPGHIYVAPGGQHMILEQRGSSVHIKLTDGPQVNFCKPAVDPLFETVASIYGSAALGVILTGMGNDGAEGSVKIADAGGSIIAQDEKTSVVWGMPGATAAAGACAAVLPLTEIAPKVGKIIKGAVA